MTSGSGLPFDRDMVIIEGEWAVSAHPLGHARALSPASQ